jgi:Holliday junction resolvase
MTRRSFSVDWTIASMAPSHANLVHDLVQYLRLAGWYVIVTPKGGITGEPGVSDLLAFKARRTVFVEAKVGRDKLRPEQEQFREYVERQGFEYVEARNVQDVADAIDKEGG